MKLTLRKANALQTSIQDYIKSVKVLSEISINEFQDAATEIAKARDEFYANYTSVQNLTKAMYDIRAKIGRANVESGVSDLLAQAAYVDKRLATLAGFVAKDLTEAQTVIDGKVAKLKAQPSETARYYGHNDKVEVSLINEDLMATMKAAQAALKKEKQAINDKVLELNIRTEIEIDSATVSLLQSVQLL